MSRPLYIILREDLIGMCPGRAAAQASHGTSDFHESMVHLSLSHPSGPSKFVVENYQRWKREAGNFGTVIVLRAPTEELNRLWELLWSFKNPGSNFTFWVKKIIDPEYCIRSQDDLFTASNVVTGLTVFIPEAPPGTNSDDFYQEIQKLKLW